MKLKRILTIAALAVCTVPSMAQYAGTQVYDRVGHGNDSIENLNALSMFSEYIKAQDWKEAYPCWKQLMEKAPYCQVKIYTSGAPMLANLILSSQETAEKKVYFDELMNLYDTRIKNAPGLNSFATQKMQTGKGPQLCRKAYDYATYAPGVDPSYSLDNAYKMFTEGITLVNDDPSLEVEGFVLYKYFDVSYQKYQADPTGFHEEFLKDYLLCKEVCEKMLEKANMANDSVEAQKIVAQYDPTLYSVESNFAASKAADRDQLIAIFTPKVEAKKNDLSYLRSVIDILADNDCDDTDVYFKASKYAFDIEPSYNAAIGTAQWCNKQGKVAESIQYYDKAIELCDNDKQKARIAMKVVYALAKSGKSSSADSYLTKVAQFDPSMAGKCDLYRAQNAATARNYDAAISYANKAAAEDPSVSGTVARLKNRISEIRKRQAEYDKANAEYKAQLEKHQKLENFWKGH